jgi:hypothetical protein
VPALGTSRRTVAARQEAQRLEAEPDALSARARTNVQRTTNYVLAVVLVATALFFAGMAARFRTHRRLRVALLVFGVVILVGTIVWLATFPLSASRSDRPGRPPARRSAFGDAPTA